MGIMCGGIYYLFYLYSLFFPYPPRNSFVFWKSLHSIIKDIKYVKVVEVF